MLLIPLHTRLLQPGDDLVKVLWGAGESQTGDIIVVSSKAVATVEGDAIELSNIVPSREAQGWAKKTGRSPKFCGAVLQEVRRLRGKIVGHCPGALLTELKPRGLRKGTILTANAGLDESNVPQGFAIGWPRDPVRAVRELRVSLEKYLQRSFKGKRGIRGTRVDFYRLQTTDYRLAIILSDSCCRPRRWGVTANALTVSGLDPLRSQVGKGDLFGRKLRMTVEAVADQLATAANVLMGNAGQGIPAVIIRDHGLSLQEGWLAGRSPAQRGEGWVPGIRSEEDLFRGVV